MSTNISGKFAFRSVTIFNNVSKVETRNVCFYDFFLLLFFFSSFFSRKDKKTSETYLKICATYEKNVTVGSLFSKWLIVVWILVSFSAFGLVVGFPRLDEIKFDFGLKVYEIKFLIDSDQHWVICILCNKYYTMHIILYYTILLRYIYNIYYTLHTILNMLCYNMCTAYIKPTYKYYFMDTTLWIL